MGTIIRVKSADFSNSPLGRVTSEDAIAAQIVSNYVEAIGDSTYQDELIAMVKSLLQNDLLDGLDIYPILGNNLSKKLVNLNPDRGTIKVDLKTGNQASSVDNYINFDQSTPVGSISGVKYKSDVVMNDFYIAADMQRVATSPNTSPLYSPFSGFLCNLGGRNVPSVGAGATVFEITGNYIAVNNTTRKLISGSIFTNSGASVGSIDLYADAVKVNEIDLSYAVTTIENYNPGIIGSIGGKHDSSDTTEIFDGKCWFFAYGFVEHSKRKLIDTIFKTFLDAVKPRS